MWQNCHVFLMWHCWLGGLMLWQVLAWWCGKTRGNFWLDDSVLWSFLVQMNKANLNPLGQPTWVWVWITISQLSYHVDYSFLVLFLHVVWPNLDQQVGMHALESGEVCLYTWQARVTYILCSTLPLLQLICTSLQVIYLALSLWPDRTRRNGRDIELVMGLLEAKPTFSDEDNLTFSKEELEQWKNLQV